MNECIRFNELMSSLGMHSVDVDTVQLSNLHGAHGFMERGRGCLHVYGVGLVGKTGWRMFSLLMAGCVGQD